MSPRTYPKINVDLVTDSFRYFVLRIQDDNVGPTFIGLHFSSASRQQNSSPAEFEGNLKFVFKNNVKLLNLFDK